MSTAVAGLVLRRMQNNLIWARLSPCTLARIQILRSSQSHHNAHDVLNCTSRLCVEKSFRSQTSNFAVGPIGILR